MSKKIFLKKKFIFLTIFLKLFWSLGASECPIKHCEVCEGAGENFRCARCNLGWFFDQKFLTCFSNRKNCLEFNERNFQCQKCGNGYSFFVSKSSNFLIYCKPVLGDDNGSEIEIQVRNGNQNLVENEAKKNDEKKSEKSHKNLSQNQVENGDEIKGEKVIENVSEVEKKEHFWIIFIPYSIVAVVAFVIMRKIFKKSKFYIDMVKKFEQFKEERKLKKLKKLEEKEKEKKRKLESPICKQIFQ